MGDGFHIGGALERPSAGLLPVAHGLGMAPGFCVVVCQEFRLGRDSLWKSGFEELRNLLVVLLPGAFQQRGVGGILDERMLKNIAGAGWPAPLIEKFGTHKLGQAVLQCVLLHGHQRLQHLIGKLPA
jgi:hypothetical protein